MPDFTNKNGWTPQQLSNLEQQSPGPAGMKLVAATPLTGFAFVNGTPNILSWTAPTDGNLHTVLVAGTVHITSNLTGGQLAVNWTTPDNTSWASNFLTAGATAGVASPNFIAVIAPGSTFTLKQNSAATLGAATAFAMIWAS